MRTSPQQPYPKARQKTESKSEKSDCQQNHMDISYNPIPRLEGNMKTMHTFVQMVLHKPKRKFSSEPLTQRTLGTGGVPSLDGDSPLLLVYAQPRSDVATLEQQEPFSDISAPPHPPPTHEPYNAHAGERLTSMNSPSPRMERTRLRSALYGEMKLTSVISPAALNSLDTSPGGRPDAPTQTHGNKAQTISTIAKMQANISWFGLGPNYHR